MKDFNLDKQFKVETGFKVPENYFDSFSKKIMTQISSEIKVDNPKIISLFDRNKKWIVSFAASFIILFTVSYYFYNLKQIKQENSEIEQYIVTNSTITDEDIAQLLDENDIKKINIEYQLELNSSENIDLENLNLEETL